MRAARPAALLAVAATAAALVGGIPAGAAGGSDVRLVVQFRAGIPSASALAVLTRAGVTTHRSIPDLATRVVTVPAARAGAALAGLRADRSVAAVEPDATAVPTDVVPNDPYFPTGAGSLNGGEWGSQLTQAPKAWSLSTGAPTTVIAVLDSGVMASHPDLAPVLVPGHNVLTGTADTTDTFGHGTEVAGVAVAASNNGQGIAAYCWSCALMPVKVYNSTSAYTSDIAAGITWAVDRGARVLNISLAGTSSSSVLTSAVSYANAHGAVVVAAAGNNGNATPTYPAATPGVISVAASDQTDTLYPYSDYGSWVSLAAPGQNLTTLPNGGYGAVGGTSLASPVVAGIAGLMLSLHPNATPTDVAAALTTTTDPTRGTTAAAHGRANAYAALSTLTGSPTPPPPSTTPVTRTLTGTIGKSGSVAFPLTVGAGPSSSTLTFGGRCAALTLTVSTSAGTVLGRMTGASGLTLPLSLAAGPDVWTVSGSCKVSFSLGVTTAP